MTKMLSRIVGRHLQSEHAMHHKMRQSSEIRIYTWPKTTLQSSQGPNAVAMHVQCLLPTTKNHPSQYTFGGLDFAAQDVKSVHITFSGDSIIVILL